MDAMPATTRAINNDPLRYGDQDGDVDRRMDEQPSQLGPATPSIYSNEGGHPARADNFFEVAALDGFVASRPEEPKR
jgi:hypothetical protein